MSSESQEIIDRFCGQFRKLLTDNWVEFWAFRDGERDVKGAFPISVGCEGRQYTLTLGFSYGIRVKRQESETFNPAQRELDFAGNSRTATQKIAMQ